MSSNQSLFFRAAKNHATDDSPASYQFFIASQDADELIARAAGSQYVHNILFLISEDTAVTSLDVLVIIVLTRIQIYLGE